MIHHGVEIFSVPYGQMLEEELEDDLPVSCYRVSAGAKKTTRR